MCARAAEQMHFFNFNFLSSLFTRRPAKTSLASKDSMACSKDSMACSKGVVPLYDLRVADVLISCNGGRFTTVVAASGGRAEMRADFARRDPCARSVIAHIFDLYDLRRETTFFIYNASGMQLGNFSVQAELSGITATMEVERVLQLLLEHV